MKFTNKHNLPQPIVDAILNNSYDKGKAHLSVSELLAPPRIRVLKKQFEETLTEDVSDLIYSLLGQLMHALLERANNTALAEKRLYIDIDGIVLSGQADAIYDTTTRLIQDYKLLSVYQVQNGLKPEFEQQLNCYAYLAMYGYYYEGVDKKKLNLLIENLEIVGVMRDWSKLAAMRDETMPQSQIQVLSVPVWPAHKTQEFIKSRIAIHKSANHTLPECTDEERWATPTKWAVMQPGRAKSLKNHESKVLAEIHAAQVAKGRVEIRLGSSNRCHYCPVKAVCTQWATIKQTEKQEKEKRMNHGKKTDE